ncbi:hypothetical protein NDU88_003720 [Pleurodeles waltl]|uniref:Uncharacterized protein n=1 Tax=Pleurodeles waltl TaxID=8319 RepID=A0AAV7TP52_PLEWA|nr:hypothetical protein NDU88_003720 [Pleurodeles waltl]
MCPRGSPPRYSRWRLCTPPGQLQPRAPRGCSAGVPVGSRGHFVSTHTAANKECGGRPREAKARPELPKQLHSPVSASGTSPRDPASAPPHLAGRARSAASAPVPLDRATAAATAATLRGAPFRMT